MARRFRFPLDPLLRLRRRDEEAAQRAVADLERQRRDLESALRDHQQRMESGRQSARDLLIGRLDLRTVRGQAQHSLHLMKRTNQIVLQLAGVHRRLKQACAVLTERRRDRRAIELLREKRLAEWRAEHRWSEQAVLDDLAACLGRSSAVGKEREP